jgi:hypothetical protein
VKVFWVCDHTEVTSKKDGKKYKDQIRVIAMKNNSYKILKKQVQQYFEGETDISFAGLTVLISRSTAKNSPNTGDIFTIKGRVPKMPKEWLKKDDRSYNIESLQEDFKPLAKKDLARLIHRIDPDEEND